MGIRLRRLLLRNVASYGVRHNEVDFTSLDYPLYVSGPNGAGKTTFFVDGLSFALFGSAYGLVRGAGRLIIPAGKRAGGEVLLELDRDGEIIIIRRLFDGRSWKVEIREGYGNNLKLVTNSVVEADNYIKRLLGLEYQSFINSIVVRQGDVYSFLNAKPSERRELLLNLLNINFEGVRNRLRSKIRDLEGELNAIERELSVLEEGLEYTSIEDIDKEINKINSDIASLDSNIKKLDEKLSEVESTINMLNEMIGKYSEKINSAKKLRGRIEEIWSNLGLDVKWRALDMGRIRDLVSSIIEYFSLIDSHEKAKSEIDRLESLMNYFDKVGELKNKLSNLNEEKSILINDALSRTGYEPSIDSVNLLTMQIGEFTSKLREIKERVRLLEDKSINKCPLCGQDITEEHRARLLSRLRKEYNILNKQYKEVSEKKNYLMNVLQRVRKLDDEIKLVLGKLEELDAIIKGYNLEDIRSKASMLKKTLADLGNKINDLAERLEKTGLSNNFLRELYRSRDLLSEVSLLIKDLIDLEESMASLDIEEITSKLDVAKDERENLLSAKYMAIARLESLRIRVKDLSQQREKLKRYLDLRNERERLHKEKRILNLLDEYVFRDSRFPRFLLKRLVEDILNSLVNDILKTFFPGASVDMVVAEEARGIDLIIYIDNVKREASTLSGGEKTLIGFAIRLGIGELIAGLGGGSSIDFLIIDEGFGALDEVNRDLVANAVGNLVDSGIYKQVIVISHESDLRNHPVFKSHIYVTRDGGYSNIEII